MLNTKLLPFARRMQWVRKQKKSGHQLGFGCAENGRLAPTVGVSAEKNPPRDFLAQGCNRVHESLAIAFRIARKRWAGAPLLAVGQIAAQNEVALSGKSFTERHQQWSRRVRTRAVRQDQGVTVRRIWSVQPSSYRGLERELGKWDLRLHRSKAPGFSVVAGNRHCDYRL